MKTNILCYAGYTAQRERRRLRARIDRSASLQPTQSSAPLRRARVNAGGPLQARWQLSPATGRLEMRWQVAEAGALVESSEPPAAAA